MVDKSILRTIIRKWPCLCQPLAILTVLIKKLPYMVWYKIHIMSDPYFNYPRLEIQSPFDQFLGKPKEKSCFLKVEWHCMAFSICYSYATRFLKVRVKLKNFADLDFDLDPNWGITPKIETLYNLSCLPETWLIYKNIEDLASK